MKLSLSPIEKPINIFILLTYPRTFSSKSSFLVAIFRLWSIGSASQLFALLADDWTAFISCRSSCFEIIPFLSRRLISASD
jgi:hypothetical protein